MRRVRTIAVIVSSTLLAAGCSASSHSGTSTVSTASTAGVEVSSTTAAVTVPVTSSASTSAPTTEPPRQQLAIWPAADVVIATPEEAARDFLLHVFGVGPVVGTFQGLDERSGELPVFATSDGVALGHSRSMLILRRLGPADGWFVIAAVSDAVTVATPASMATLTPGPVDVTGSARGFEASIGVVALLAGHADRRFDQRSILAGNETPLPFTASIDLSSAAPGAVVVILVHGGTGLETDPGEFSAIPVLMAG